MRDLVMGSVIRHTQANDRGFECLLLSDRCGATDFGNHQAAIKKIKMQGGVFGSVSDSATFVTAIAK
jgi:nicotinamidase-related amidase